jgi:hypothetical protein
MAMDGIILGNWRLIVVGTVLVSIFYNFEYLLYRRIQCSIVPFEAAKLIQVGGFCEEEIRGK